MTPPSRLACDRTAALPRPPEKSRARHYGGALLDRAYNLALVARAGERIRAARAPEADGPAPDGRPYPPARLRVLVIGGGSPEGFWEGGRASAGAILHALGEAGIDPAGLGRVLDFGCGCGRVARHWSDQPWELHGCDYNAEPVAWCNEHLAPMTARVNRLEPSAPYADDSFDFLYAISVVTHLTPELAATWVDEWTRILRPGGVLLVTTIGHTRRHALNERGRDRYDAGEPVVVRPRVQGLNACVAHHPPSYVTETLLGGLEVLAQVPGDTVPDFPQDAYVARVS